MNYVDRANALPWIRGVKILKIDPNGLLAVEKPTGVMSHPNRKSDLGKALLQAHYDSKEQAYRVVDDEGEETLVFLLNRLDSATSGVVLLSLNDEIVGEVKAAFERKRVEKIYKALVFGAPRGGSPSWKDRINVKSDGHKARASGGGGLLAETRLLDVKRFPGPPLTSLLTLQPITGRTHQLRIQTSKRGMPIVGDRTYGNFQKNRAFGRSGKHQRLCLHCESTKLEYRYKGKSFKFQEFSKCPF